MSHYISVATEAVQQKWNQSTSGNWDDLGNMLMAGSGAPGLTEWGTYRGFEEAHNRWLVADKKVNEAEEAAKAKANADAKRLQDLINNRPSPDAPPSFEWPDYGAPSYPQWTPPPVTPSSTAPAPSAPTYTPKRTNTTSYRTPPVNTPPPKGKRKLLGE